MTTKISATVVIHVYKFENVFYVVGPTVIYETGGLIGRQPFGELVKAYQISGDKFPHMPDLGFTREEDLQSWFNRLRANGLEIKELSR